MISECINKLIKSKDYNITNLSKDLGVSRSYLSKVKNNEKPLSAEKTIKLIEIISISDISHKITLLRMAFLDKLNGGAKTILDEIKKYNKFTEFNIENFNDDFYKQLNIFYFDEIIHKTALLMTEFNKNERKTLHRIIEYMHENKDYFNAKNIVESKIYSCAH